MKTPTYQKPLRIRVDESVIIVGEVYIQLGHVRVQGWISAPSKAAAFKASQECAERLGVRCLGACAYGASETEAVSLPFSFDIQNRFHPKYPRREDMAETVERVMKSLRSAQQWFGRSKVAAT